MIDQIGTFGTDLSVANARYAYVVYLKVKVSVRIQRLFYSREGTTRSESLNNELSAILSNLAVKRPQACDERREGRDRVTFWRRVVSGRSSHARWQRVV